MPLNSRTAPQYGAAEAHIPEIGPRDEDSAVGTAHWVWLEQRTRLAVSPNINISGHLAFQEPVRIEGGFRGEISSTELVVISEDGFVEGEIRAPCALILGRLRGSITAAKSVVLGPRAKLDGRIKTERLTVCEGAWVEADIRVAASETVRRGN